MAYRLDISTSIDCWESYLRLVSKPRKKLKDIVGKKIHLNSTGGLYTVSEYKHPILTITCRKWQNMVDYGQRKEAFKEVYVSDFKCLAGGYHNSLK
jgi:hypothetical protein